MKRRRLVIGIMALVLGLLPPWTTACWVGGAQPIKIRVDFDRTVATFEPERVKVTLTGDRKWLKGPALVRARVSLPQSMAYINGELRWEGTVAPGKKAVFESTLAMVVEGASSAYIWVTYSFTDPAGNRHSGGDEESITIRAATPGARQRIYESYSPHDSGVSQDHALLNNAEEARLVIFAGRPESYEILESMGLAPAAKEPRTYFDLINPLFRNDTVVVGLFDRKRGTTGFHIGLLSIVSQHRGQTEGGYLLNFVATAPRSDWPVEGRDVSPYVLYPLGWQSEQQTMEVVIRINDQIVGRHLITRPRGPEQPVVIPVHFSPKTSP